MTADGLLQVFLENRPALLRFLRARGAPPSEAEDVLQDVYLKLGEVPSGPVAQPRAYLYRVVGNRLLDHRRTAARRHRREEEWVDLNADALRELDDRPGAEAIVVGRQRLAVLQAALDELPERTATIFRRFRIDGVGQRVIADELGLSVSAVEKHLQRAYHAVLEAMAGLDADHPPVRRLTPE